MAVVAMAAAASPALAGDAEVAALAARKAAIIGNMHTKASKAMVNYAQDQAFAAYFNAAPDQRKPLKERIDAISLAVQANFKVEEMCVITDKGQEISRIVGNAVAPDADLSADETGNTFFKPAFDTEPKQVYIAPVYVSADAKKWVVAYSSPLVANGKKVAISHYEYSLADYQQALAKDMSGADTYVVAVNAQGFVLADSRAAIDVAAKTGKADPADYFKKLPAAAAAIKLGADGQGSFSDGGATWKVAFKPVQDWTIAAIEKQK
jgi:hypothetical protein